MEIDQLLDIGTPTFPEKSGTTNNQEAAPSIPDTNESNEYSPNNNNQMNHPTKSPSVGFQENANKQPNPSDEEGGGIALASQRNISSPIFNQVGIPRSPSTNVQLDIGEFADEREEDIMVSKEAFALKVALNFESNANFNLGEIKEDVDEEGNAPFPEIKEEIEENEEKDEPIQLSPHKNRNEYLTNRSLFAENGKPNIPPVQIPSPSAQTAPCSPKTEPKQAFMINKNNRNMSNSSKPPKTARCTNDTPLYKRIKYPRRLFKGSLKSKYSDEDLLDEILTKPSNQNRPSSRITTTESIETAVMKKKQWRENEKENFYSEIQNNQHKLSDANKRKAKKAEKRTETHRKNVIPPPEEEIKPMKHAQKLPAYLANLEKFNREHNVQIVKKKPK